MLTINYKYSTRHIVFYNVQARVLNIVLFKPIKLTDQNREPELPKVRKSMRQVLNTKMQWLLDSKYNILLSRRRHRQ